MMHLTQGTFSFLPPLTRRQIAAQVQYCLDRRWAISIEYTDDPHPRNTYWELFGQPMFDIADAEGVMVEVDRALRDLSGYYVKINGFDATIGWETVRLSFIVARPEREPGFRLLRQESEGRRQSYSTESYAVAAKPAGERFERGG
jgi:ribulose-bisphosphate carboxylase small chain